MDDIVRSLLLTYLHFLQTLYLPFSTVLFLFHSPSLLNPLRHLHTLCCPTALLRAYIPTLNVFLLVIWRKFLRLFMHEYPLLQHNTVISALHLSPFCLNYGTSTFFFYFNAPLRFMTSQTSVPFLAFSPLCMQLTCLLHKRNLFRFFTLLRLTFTIVLS